MPSSLSARGKEEGIYTMRETSLEEEPGDRKRAERQREPSSLSARLEEGSTEG